MSPILESKKKSIAVFITVAHTIGGSGRAMVLTGESGVILNLFAILPLIDQETGNPYKQSS